MQQIEVIIIFVFFFFITFLRCYYLLFPFLDAMSSLPMSNVSSSSFAQSAQDVSDSEQSSDNGSISNSVAEPEMQDSKVEVQEDNIRKLWIM